MSPFLVLAFFFFWSGFSSKNFASGCAKSDDLDSAWPMASLIFTICGLAQSAALRSPAGRSAQGEAEGQANDGRDGLPAILAARFCTSGRAGSCHG